jgi:hypothetical protein
MGPLTVLLTVLVLLVGGQALFLDVLRLGLVAVVIAALVGAMAGPGDGRLVGAVPARRARSGLSFGPRRIGA